MLILERKYGNDGYAFWFKLLEILGDTEGHFIDCNNFSNFQFLIAKVNLTEEKATVILDDLATIGAIDKEMWGKRVVWSQNFVNNLSDLYSRRKMDIPTKDMILSEVNPNAHLDEFIKKQENCRRITRQAIESGILNLEPCVICGTEKNIEAHHPDYDNPFLVYWLCKSEHSEWHSYARKLSLNEFLSTETILKAFIEDKKSERRGEERRGKERRGKKTQQPPVPPTSPQISSPQIFFFSCPYFDIDHTFRIKLAKEYPALNDELLLKQFSKMENYISDHPRKYSFKANGKMANPKNFITNWLDKEKVPGSTLFGPKQPKGREGLKNWMEEQPEMRGKTDGKNDLRPGDEKTE
jgi:hypothetical protein